MESLVKKKHELEKKILELRGEVRKIQKIQDANAAKEAVVKKVESMSDTEKKIAAQILSPKGIKSEEKVGNPGAK